MKIYGHRGATKYCPENTLASFKRAMELGVDVLELDVYKISDGTLAVHHDDILGRCEDERGYIQDLDYTGLKSITPNKGYDEDFSYVTIPTLDEVLELVAGTETGLDIELKYQGINGVVDDVAIMLENYRMTNKCKVTSFTKTYILSMKEKYPQISCGIIYHTPFSDNIVEYCKKYRIDSVMPHYLAVDKGLVQGCLKEKIEICPWLVNNEKEIKRMRQLGVTAIITDEIETAIKYK